jgi:CCR4-NOT transcription complex subunit 7/8
MDMLKNSGFDFEKHKNQGIPHMIFATHIIDSNLVLNNRNHWITFHGGMDFGYLFKELSGLKLPEN